MAAIISIECPECKALFVKDTQEYYWHLKIHLAEIELKKAQKELKQINPLN